MMALPKHLSYSLISLIILGFFAGQLIATFVPVIYYYWPFMDYPMYSGVHKENELVNDNYVMIGIQFNGDERSIEPGELGLSFFQFNDWFVPRLLQNTNNQSIQQYLEHVRSLHQQAFQKIRIQGRPVVVSREGISEPKLHVFTVIDLYEKDEIS